MINSASVFIFRYLSCIRKALLFISLSLSSLFCAAQSINPNALMTLDDPRIKAIEWLAYAKGKVQSLPVKPWSLGQARDILLNLAGKSGLDGIFADLAGWNSGLGSSEKALLASLDSDLHAGLGANPSGFDARLEFTVSPEIYLHTNQAGEDDSNHWEYGYNQRNPLLALDTQAQWGIPGGAGDLFYGFWGDLYLDLKEDQTVVDMYLSADRAQNYSNIPEDITYIDFQFPHRALVSTGGKNWLLVGGRGSLDMGNGQTGNLSVSDVPDFNDFVRFQLLGTWLNYTSLWVDIESDLGGLNGKNGAVDLRPIVKNVHTDAYDDAKNLFLHRLDFNIADTLHLGLTEAVIVGGIQPSLKYVNPFIVFHNMYPWLDSDFESASSFLGLEATFAPVRGVQLWYQYGQNQLQTSFETTVYPGSNVIPNSYGMLAGAAWTGGISPDQEDRLPWMLNVGFEWAYTNPWLYVRENGLNSWFWRRRLVSNVTGAAQFVTKPLGWYLGPDSISATGWVELAQYNFLNVRLDLEYRLQGENSITSAYEETAEAAALVTPTGVPMETWIIGVSGDALVFEASEWLPRTTFYSDIHWLTRSNADHVTGKSWQDLQAVIGVNFAW